MLEENIFFSKNICNVIGVNENYLKLLKKKADNIILQNNLHQIWKECTAIKSFLHLFKKKDFLTG